MSALAVLERSQRISRWISSICLRTLIIGATAIGLCAPAADVTAQSLPPATRPYQMSILASTDSVSNAGSDIPIFTRNVFTNYQAQPAGRSIAWLPPDANLDQHNIDWTRIIAVYVDEPYALQVVNNKSCTAPGVADTRQALTDMAAALRARAPSARFWVNFSQPEVELIRDEGCSLNEPYIDVVSMDIYGIDFANSALSALYQFVYEHRPTSYQQLALVAGTFTMEGQDPTEIQSQALRLQGFVDYAASMNQSCELPLGPTGVTGFYDGCPVWMITGFTGGVTPVPEEPILPIDHPNSLPVFNAWQNAFAIRRVDPTNIRRARALAPSLLLLQE